MGQEVSGLRILLPLAAQEGFEMKTIYHSVFPDETITFLDEDSRNAFLARVAVGVPADQIVNCQSEVTEEQYKFLELAGEDSQAAQRAI